MPSKQSKDQRRFTEGRKDYLAAIEASKITLTKAIQFPSEISKEADRLAREFEKQARKKYQKAGKKLRSHIET
jgi:hypothetical protein